MPTINLLYQRSYKINDWLSVVIPTVGEILDDEDSYYSMVSMLTAMPIDFMVPLDDAGIDFTQINEYELFLLLFPALQNMDTHLVFGDVDLKRFSLMQNDVNGQVILRDTANGYVIDRAIHNQIATTLRSINKLERNNKRPGNDEAKRYMLERARVKAMRRKRKEMSQTEQLIVAMVNTEQFKYGFEEVRDLTIYQFNESVRQIIKKVEYDQRMTGVYAGTIDPKSISQDDLNWLIHK